MTPRLRLIAWYVAAFGALGALPYLASVLSDKGLSDPDIAVVMALLPMGALFASPAWSWLADRTGRGRTLLTLTTLGTTLGMTTVALGHQAALLTVGVGLYAFSRAPQTALVDALAVRTLGDGGRDYGRVRLWGSLAFLAVAFSLGWARDVWGPAPVVLGAILLSTTLLASRVLPHRNERVPRPELRHLSAAFASRTTLLLAAACVLHGVGMAFYNGFLSRHLDVLGLPSRVLGISLAVGVGIEVVVMALSPWLLDRVRPSRLLFVAFMASVPRWFGTALATTAAPMIAIQALHGLSFGLFWVAAVPTFARVAHPSVARSAQSILTATAFGIGPLLSAPIAWAVLADHPPATLFTIAGVASLLSVAVLAPVALRPPRPVPTGYASPMEM